MSFDVSEDTESAGGEHAKVRRLAEWLATEGDTTISGIMAELSITEAAAKRLAKSGTELGMFERHQIHGEIHYQKVGGIKDGGTVALF